MQFFKQNDPNEIKIVNATNLMFDQRGAALDLMYQQVYQSREMAEFLYDNNFVALSNVINREVFINTINEIFDAWAHAGTFESYLTILRKIFGNSAIIEFEVPNPGCLDINIISTAYEVANFVARQKVGDGYQYFNIVDGDGNRIVFYNLMSSDGQLDITKIIKTIVPGGIFVTITYDILEEEEFKAVWLKKTR